MEDIRKGLPSASGAGRLFQCAGSWLAEQSFPKEASNADANLGTKRHTLIETEVTEFDNAEDEYVATRAKELVQQAIDDSGMAGKDHIRIKEKRMWMFNSKLKRIFSGQPDEVLLFEKDHTAIIVDYKTLYGDHVEARKNEQLIALAALVHTRYKTKTVIVALIQPNAGKDRQLTMCVFDEKTLKMATNRLIKQLDKIQQPNQKRCPGKYCDYCSFRLKCPENMADTWLMATEPQDVAQITNVEYLDKIALAEKMLKDLKIQEYVKAKTQLEQDPDCLPGYRIVNGKKTKKVNAAKAWPILIGKLPGIAIAEAMDLKPRQLQHNWKNATGAATLKAAAEDLEVLLEKATEVNVGESYVKRG